MIKIRFKENIYEFKDPICIEDFIKNIRKDELNGIPVSSTVNNIQRDLTHVITSDSTINIIDTSSSLGQKIYKNSLSFLFLKAVYDTLDKASVTLCHSINTGQYCEIKGCAPVNTSDLNKIKNRMLELVHMDLPFKKHIKTKEEAIEQFTSIKKIDHVSLLKTMYKETISIYNLDGYLTYFNEAIVPSTKYLKNFDILPEGNGVILICPSKQDIDTLQTYKPQPKLLQTFQEIKSWGEIMHVSTVAELNQKILHNTHNELISTIEALHEKKIANIAQSIFDNKKRMVLLAGPSSSGKTTTSRRIETQLRVLGLKPLSISLDDYFVNRDDTPLDEFGQKDYESIYALDLTQFNKDMLALLHNEEIHLPKYNFVTGKREYHKSTTKLGENQPIILEGIHALNPLLTSEISECDKFKIYISPITQLNLDNHNRLSSTDCRLMRRIVRDFNFRGNSAENTFKMWESVRRGEEKNIFPYQEEADVIINSTLIYEVSVLKKYIEPLLISVNMESPHYIDAKRLLNILTFFIQINDESSIPPTSIIKEFIGNSSLV